MKTKILAILLLGLILVSCREKDKTGVLYLLNTSSVEKLELVSTLDKSVIVNKGAYYTGLVYFATFYGSWNNNYSAYSLLNCAVGLPYIKSVTIDNSTYILTDSLSKSFSNIKSYTKIVDEHEEYFYEMDDNFIKLIKQDCKKLWLLKEIVNNIF